MEGGEPIFIDRRLFESTTRPADGPAGDRGSRFSNTDDTSLSLDMLSDAEYRGSHSAKAFGMPSSSDVMLLPCQSPGGRVVGIITLHDDLRADNKVETDSRLVSLLRDFAAHVAIAVQSVHGRRRAAPAGQAANAARRQSAG